MLIRFRLGLRLHARNSLVMTPFEVTVLSVTLNAAGTVPSATILFQREKDIPLINCHLYKQARGNPDPRLRRRRRHGCESQDPDTFAKQHVTGAGSNPATATSSTASRPTSRLPITNQGR